MDLFSAYRGLRRWSRNGMRAPMLGATGGGRMGWSPAMASANEAAFPGFRRSFAGRAYTAAGGRFLRRTGGVAPWRGSGGRSTNGPLNAKDTVFGAVAISADAASPNIQFLLNGTIPGDAITDRHARTITMKAVQIDLEIRPPAVVMNTSLRWFLVYDMQTNATSPGYSNIWETIAGSAPPKTIAQLHTPRNLSNIDRFKIIKQGKMFINNETVAATSNSAPKPYGYIKKYIKLNLPTKYNQGTAGTVADIQTGSLSFFIIQDNSLSSCTLNGYIRLSFVP